MKFLDRKAQIEKLREKLKDNPKALAELDFFDYQEKTNWWHTKLDRQIKKQNTINKYFLRG